MQGRIDDKGPFPKYFNDDYYVIGVLGRGGMGYVYKAVHKALNREVALKVLDAAVGDDAAKRFYLEAQAMKKLDHQNIVQVYDFGRVGEQLFIAMTFVPGATLADILRDRKKLEPSEILRILRQVARGLLYAHNRGIVHRDIKPSNIIVSTQDRVYITDFGISQMQELDRLTSTGMAMGTPEYMSPEQCQGGQVTLQSDVYSIGVVLFEMLTGAPPFTGTKPLSVAWKQVYEEPPKPSSKLRNTPIALEQLILECLRKDPLQRPQDMGVLLEDLDEVERELGGGVDKRPTTTQQQVMASSQTQQQPHTEPPLTTQRHSKAHQQDSSLAGSNPRSTNKDRSHSSLVRILFGSAAVLFMIGLVLAVIFLLPDRSSPGLGFMPITSVEGPNEQVSVEGASGPKGGYPTSMLVDGDLKTAWIAPLRNPAMPLLQVKLAKPTLVFALGFANGYQRSLDDAFQDRFAYTAHPADVTIKGGGDVVRRIRIPDLRGMQYVQLSPFEATEFSIQVETLHIGTSPDVPIAMSEIKVLGLPLPE